MAPWTAHAAVWFLALLSGSLAYTLRDQGLAFVEVSEAAIFTYLQPVWSAILAVLWLGEPVTMSYTVGGSILVAGVILSEYRSNGTSKHKKYAAKRR